MIAQLGMYDRPSTLTANDRLWSLIRQHLGYGPDHLNRDLPVDRGWVRPDLILSQTCGYPFRALLVGKVSLVGTPDYGLEGCPPGYYRSVFVTRHDDPGSDVSEFSGATFAYNEALSQSGWAAPRHHLDLIDVQIGSVKQSGGHEYSARAVKNGLADFASLDALSWALIKRDCDWAEELKEIDSTTPTPALPYICGLGQDRVAIRNALDAAIGDLELTDRSALHLQGLIEIPESDYLAVPTPKSPSELHD